MLGNFQEAYFFKSFDEKDISKFPLDKVTFRLNYENYDTFIIFTLTANQIIVKQRDYLIL